MKNRHTIMLSFILTGCIAIFFFSGSSMIVDSLKNKLLPSAQGAAFSEDLVFDGSHHKLSHPLFKKNDNIYFSLPDLENILSIRPIKKDSTVSIHFDGRSLTYQDGTLTNAESDDTRSYIMQDDVIYLPGKHIEKFLGIGIDYYFHKNTHTISLSSPEEQQKPPSAQNVGTTLFLYKSVMPHAPYEPKSGLYAGAYVLQDEHINQSMRMFNELTDKQHATFFKYVGYGKPFPKKWVEEVKQAGGFPHIAWEPNHGLDEVKNDAYLQQFAQDAAASDVPVLLRYASEMNGTWTFYSGHAKKYIEKWKLVHDVMKANAPNVMMLWNVFTMPERTIKEFYPGDAYVDYVGVNIYNVLYHNDKIDVEAGYEDPLRLLDYVYNTFSARKPIVIGEFGASNYAATDGKHHDSFAADKITRMYHYLPHLYPRVKFIYYFDVNNLVNAPEGRKINNYAITEKEHILHTYANAVKNPTFLSSVAQHHDRETDDDLETFTYRDFMFRYRGELYVDVGYVRDYLGMKVTKGPDAGRLQLSYNGKIASFTCVKHYIDKAAFFEKRELTGLPIINILETFHIKYEYRNGDLHLWE